MKEVRTATSRVDRRRLRRKTPVWVAPTVAALAVSGLVILHPVGAQPRLHAGLLNTKGYVVGATLSASGLYRLESDTTWTHIGWNHPRVSAIAADPRDSRTMYLAAGNGLLRTRDGGESWRITTDWEVTESQGVAVDPHAPDEVYVSTAYGVWASRDGAQTWIASNDGLEQTYVQAIAVDRIRHRRLLAGTWGGLHVSEDGAETWSMVTSSDVSVLDVQQSIVEPDVWLAGTQNHGVLLSRDNGATWQPLPATEGLSIYSVAADPSAPGRFAAVGWDTGVLVSEDGGVSWARRDAGLPIADFYRVIFDPASPETLYVATVERGVYRSDDLGATWAYAGLDGTLIFHLTFIE